MNGRQRLLTTLTHAKGAEVVFGVLFSPAFSIAESSFLTFPLLPCPAPESTIVSSGPVHASWPEISGHANDARTGPIP